MSAAAVLRLPVLEPRVLEIIERYEYVVAERVWIIPHVRIIEDFDGEPSLPGDEVTRMTLSVANEVCTSLEPLNSDALEFLCELTGHFFAEIARKLGVTRATVSHWLRKGKEVPLAQSLILKKWFWAQLFPKAITPHLTFTLEELLDDALVLQRLHDEAIRLGLAEAVTSEPLPTEMPSTQTSADVS